MVATVDIKKGQNYLDCLIKFFNKAKEVLRGALNDDSTYS